MGRIRYMAWRLVSYIFILLWYILETFRFKGNGWVVLENITGNWLYFGFQHLWTFYRGFINGWTMRLCIWWPGLGWVSCYISGTREHCAYRTRRDWFGYVQITCTTTTGNGPFSGYCTFHWKRDREVIERGPCTCTGGKREASLPCRALGSCHFTWTLLCDSWRSVKSVNSGWTPVHH